jgi:hypothetical protein
MSTPPVFARTIRAAICALGVTCFLAPFALADRVVTQDGRILSPKKARTEGTGYKLTFANGEVVLPDKTLVREVEIEGDMSDYVPANDDEKQKLAQGFVRYQKKWFSAAAYQEELHKKFEASKKRTEEIKKHSDWANCWTKETQHFKFKCNASAELLDYYAELLETYYNLQDTRIGINPPPNIKRQKMDVNIYRSNEDFHKYGSEDNPAVLGYFSPSDGSLNFYHEYQEPAQSTWVALHECTHLLTFLIEPQYRPQIWLNEAVADYFGSSKVYRGKNGKLVIEPGQLQIDRVLTVQQALKDEGSKTGAASNKSGKKLRLEDRPFTKLEDLFMLSREAFDGFQYAHAWSFVYFLNNFDNGKYQKNFNRFFKGLYTLEKGLTTEPVGGDGKMVSPKDIREYLLKRLGVKDVPQLEADWRKFVAEIPIIGPEARLKRGLQSIWKFDLDQAREDLDAAIEGGVKDPRAYAGRAKVKAFQGEIESGIPDMQKAIELDPLDAAYRYELSQMMMGRVSTASARHGGLKIVENSDEKLSNADAKVQAGLAMELDPENDSFREWFERFE